MRSRGSPGFSAPLCYMDAVADGPTASIPDVVAVALYEASTLELALPATDGVTDDTEVECLVPV